MRVKGEGPVPARIMFVGEAPGQDEDRTGRPFVGAAGKELTRFLDAIGIRRAECFITNLVRERPPNNRDPHESEIRRDEEELRVEIARVRPEIIVPLGRISTRWFLGDVDMETHHGLPFPVQIGDTSALVVPIYHPAAGLHSPDMQTLIDKGMRGLKAVVDGELKPLRDEYPEPNYILSPSEKAAVWKAGRVMAMDTEGLPGSPWGLSLTFEEGKALVVRADDERSLGMVRALVQNSSLVVLHNSLHDLEVLRDMGVEIAPGKFTDTMVMAYLLGDEPQGLKPLAFRHAGMVMSSYLEVISDADQEVALGYLKKVLAFQCHSCGGGGLVLKPKKKGGFTEKKCEACNGDGTRWPEPQIQIVWENGEASEYKPQSIGRRVKKIVADGDDDGDDVVSASTPRERWEAIEPELRKPVELALGPMPPTTLDNVKPPEKAVRYSARDADATIRVYRALTKRVGDMGLDGVLAMDLSVIPMIDRMQNKGWLIDSDHFRGLTSEFELKMRQLTDTIRKQVGHFVNPASSKQVADLLFRQMGLPVVKMTKSKTAESTDDKVLESLKLKVSRGEVETGDGTATILDNILHYRELAKLVGTYTTALVLKADRFGRVHPHLRITRTSSGRLSSFDPNLQNIPTRQKHGRDNGKRIRAGFIAPEGFRLGSWDLDQIEMRVLAHESADPNLVKLFTGGALCPIAREKGKCKCHDIHLLTASLIYKKPIDQITADERELAKNIGFGIVYGITSKGLRAQMELRGQDRSEEECQMMIDAYLNDAYPGVRDYMERKAAEARRFGYVKDMFGRLRYLPAIHSTAQHVAAEATRQAGNHPIQAGAQGIIKLAMGRIWNDVLPMLWKSGLRVECLMQIHDELIFEFEDGLEDLIDPMIRRAFREAVDLLVPIGSKGNTGLRWSELKG